MLADVGGTYTRLVILKQDGSIEGGAKLNNAEHDGLAQTIQSYLAQQSPSLQVTQARLALACPVLGDRISLTNRDWSFSVEELRTELGLKSISCVNDLAAIAHAAPHLTPKDFSQIGRGNTTQHAPIGIVGPGTGLGISALVPTDDGYVPVSTEGGHATLASSTPLEDQVIAFLRKRFGHVSAERVLSGQGLVNLYDSLSYIDGVKAEPLKPSDVTAEGRANPNSLCGRAVSLFCSFLGTVCADLALTLGARGGIYISGGIAPQIADVIDDGTFRTRFETKGRFSDYLSKIPTYLITHPNPAFIGLANME